MDCAASSAVLVVGAAEKLLIAFERFGGAEVQFRFAVGTEYQPRKQTFPICLCRSALVLPEFLYPQPHIFINDRFLRVWNDLVFLFRILDHLVHLVADRCGFSVHRASGVLLVF